MAEANYSIKAQIEANTRKFKNAIQSAKKVAQSFKKTQESIKDTKLDGDSSGVMKAVKAAKDAVKGFDNTHADAELDADISDVREKVAQAKTLVEKFDAYRGDAELDADVSKATANIKKVQKYLDMYDNSDAEADADVNIRKAITHISELQHNLDSIDGKKYSATLDADATRAREHIKMAKKQLNDFAHQKAKVNLEVDSAGAMAKIQTFKVMLRSIPNRVRTRLDVDGGNSLGFFRSLGAAIEESTKTWDKLATKIRTIGTVLGNMIKGALLSNITLLVPAIASLVPALMAVLNAIGVVTGGALGLAGAFGVAGAGAVAFGAMGISALTMLADGTLEATRETERYQASLDSLQDAWAGLIKRNQAQIFNTLANAIDTAKVALAGLTPFIDGVSKGMEQASAKMLDWAKNSQVAQKFFEMMGTTGVRIFNNMLDAAGSFGSGLISVLTQIAPLAEWVSQGFKKMGQSFNEWAQSVEGQNAIKSFIEYTKQNLPLIGQIFGSTFRGIFNLMKAFAPNTHLVLQGLADMAKQFEQWSATIVESDGFKKFIEYVQENGPKLIQLLGNIINIIINVATAMAPFAAAVLDVAIAMTDFIEKLTEAHPAIGIMLGLIATLAGIFMTLGPPILGAIDFIGTFVKAITGAETVIKGFSVIGGIVADAMEFVGAALVGIEGPVAVVIAIVGALIGVLVWLWNTNESVRNALTNAWDVISSTIGGAIQSVIDWFTQLYDNIMQTIQPLMPIFQAFGELINQVLGVVVVTVINVLVAAFQSLWNAVSVIFTAIGAIVSSVIQLIVGLFTAFIQLITGDFTGALQTLQTTFWNVLNTIWTAVQSIFTQISQFIFTSLNSILGTSISSWSQIFSSTYQFLSQIFSSVAQWFGQVAQTIASKMAQALGYIISNGSQWVSSIVSTLASFVSSVISGFVRVVSSVAQYMAQALSRVVSGGAQWVSGIVSAMSNFVSSVISGFVNAVSQVQGGMQRAVSAIMSFLGQFVNAGFQMMAGLARGIMNGASQVINSAINVAKSVIGAVNGALRIHSPSRVFKEIGGYTMQGFGIGIDKEGRSVVSGMGSMANSITEAFNSNLAVPDITANMKKVNANMNAQVQHTHNIKTNPSQRVVRIEMGVDNDALTTIVNEQNANRDATFTF